VITGPGMAATTRTSTPKSLSFFLDQAAGHLQRLGRHGLLALQRAVEQVHLRQLAVGHVGEQRLLPLFGHPFALATTHGLDDLHRLRMVLLALALSQHQRASDAARRARPLPRTTTPKSPA
jgi:hypothetical protein